MVQWPRGPRLIRLRLKEFGKHPNAALASASHQRKVPEKNGMAQQPNRHFERTRRDGGYVRKAGTATSGREEHSAGRVDKFLATALDLFAERNFALSPNNLRQVRVPAGATVLTNRHGLAPGFALVLGDATLFFMPGVPRELSLIHI